MKDTSAAQQSWPIFTMELRDEKDLVQARQHTRQIASFLDYDQQELTRITTAVSELVRYAYKSAKCSRLSFALVGKNFRIAVQGPFSYQAELDHGTEASSTQDTKFSGLLGARKLMDALQQSGDAQACELSLSKLLPAKYPAVSEVTMEALRHRLAEAREQDPYAEIKQQNRELIHAFNAVKNQQSQLEQLNKELAETNQGVLALYAELEDKALSLQKAIEAKSLFFSNMTHEFRTPLNSAISLVRMLLDRQDGELTPEQERQVMYIRNAIEDLSQMVNDLLDTAKLESGKIEIRLNAFSIGDLFAALRGMFRPLVNDRPELNLIFEEAGHLPLVVSDETKVGQILRNFISNALKNTDSGEIRVAAYQPDSLHITLAVIDTGIGIAPEDQTRIFEEFVQLENLRYPTYHGTGLGLPLAKRLAALLGGRIQLQSTRGEGSTFSLVLPFGSAEDSVAASKIDDSVQDSSILTREGMSEAFSSSLIGADGMLLGNNSDGGWERPLARNSGV